LRKETLPQALKGRNQVQRNEVYQTALAPFKISDQENFDAIMFFSPSAGKLFIE
jgi:uroporphyrinogen-III synthase